VPQAAGAHRLRIEWISAAEGMRFADVVNDFTAKLKALGPLGKSEGLDQEELKSRLEEVTRLVPYIKMAKREKLALHLEQEAGYDDLYSAEEVARLFRDVVSYHIEPEKCQACMICLRKCPVEAIEGGKNRIHVIDQEKCIKCGTCFQACPPRFGAVREIVGEPVPPPIPEAQRAIARKKKMSAKAVGS
jgi:Fe-S-cluster-containing hydrogenase component 2